MNDITCQVVVATAMPERQSFVIDLHRVQGCRMEVMHMHGFVHGMPAKLVSGP